MTKTIVGLFSTMDEAQRAVQALMDSGIRKDDISVVARDQRGEGMRQHAVGDASAEGAGAGAVGGTVVGGAIGLLVGAGLLAIPGIGPVLAAGPLAAALGTTAATAGAGALGAGLGAAAGGLMGGLVGAGVSEEDARIYHDSVQRGDVLVSAAVDNSLADSAADMMRRYGAIDIEGRRGMMGHGAMSTNPRGDSLDSPVGSDASGYGTTSGTGARGSGTSDYDRGTSSHMGSSVTGGRATKGGMDTSDAIYDRRPTDDAGGGDMAYTGGDFARGMREEPANTSRPDYARGMHSYDEYESDFRNHYQSNYAGNLSYDDYSPAYRHGYSLAGDSHMRGDRWEDVEMDARRSWERDYPDTWDRFKANVRYAWERARGLR